MQGQVELVHKMEQPKQERQRERWGERNLFSLEKGFQKGTILLSIHSVCSTGNSTSCSVISYMGKESEKEKKRSLNWARTKRSRKGQSQQMTSNINKAHAPKVPSALGVENGLLEYMSIKMSTSQKNIRYRHMESRWPQSRV